jgi:hypothetical protein
MNKMVGCRYFHHIYRGNATYNTYRGVDFKSIATQFLKFNRAPYSIDKLKNRSMSVPICCCSSAAFFHDVSYCLPVEGGGIFLCLCWCHETGLCRNHKLVQWKITISANKTTEPKRNSTGTQYVTLQIKIGWRKVKACQIGSAKWFWHSIFAQFSEAGKRHSKT